MMNNAVENMHIFLTGALEVFSAIFLFILGALMVTIIVVYILDVTQSRQAIRRNYPVVAHFRYFFETMGEFFRQYFFAMDRQELPFKPRSTCLGLSRLQEPQ